MVKKLIIRSPKAKDVISKGDYVKVVKGAYPGVEGIVADKRFGGFLLVESMMGAGWLVHVSECEKQIPLTPMPFTRDEEE